MPKTIGIFVKMQELTVECDKSVESVTRPRHPRNWGSAVVCATLEGRKTRRPSSESRDLNTRV